MRDSESQRWRIHDLTAPGGLLHGTIWEVVWKKVTHIWRNHRGRTSTNRINEADTILTEASWRVERKHDITDVRSITHT